jgi:cytochrome c-type biogenesis protein CcmF
VSRGKSDTFTARPYLYYNQRMGSTMQTPAIHSLLYQDVYISPAGYDPEANPAKPIIAAGSKVTMGPYELTFVDFNLDTAAMTNGGEIKVGAKIKVLYQGQESEVEPLIQVTTDPKTGDQKLDHVPATLPGGQTLTLVEVDPTNRMVLLEGKGEGLDNLPVVPAKGVITVSVKPLVLLVWVGLGVGVLGGLIAMLRRYLEGRALLAGERVRLPKGLFGGLFGRRGLRSPRPANGD